MTKNVSVDTKFTREKEKNINEEKNKEYELRTSAPQEEMERYYARKKASLERKIRKINKKIKKNIYNPVYKRR